MLYLTNGKAQDLPLNQQFEFWDQLDWGRAYKLAKIKLAEAVGAAQAPALELKIQVLLDCVGQDPRKAWTSRPMGQAPDWCRWSSFCEWMFRMGRIDEEATWNAIRSGNVAGWYPSYAQFDSQWTGVQMCCDSNAAVDATVFWDFHEFDRSTCQSKRKVPATMPTPEEIGEAVATIEFLNSIFGTSGAKNFIDNPPSNAERAAAVSAGAPKPIEGDLNLDDYQIPPDTTGETSVLTYVVGGAIVIGLGWLLLSKR